MRAQTKSDHSSTWRNQTVLASSNFIWKSFAPPTCSPPSIISANPSATSHPEHIMVALAASFIAIINWDGADFKRQRHLFLSWSDFPPLPPFWICNSVDVGSSDGIIGIDCWQICLPVQVSLQHLSERLVNSNVGSRRQSILLWMKLLRRIESYEDDWSFKYGWCFRPEQEKGLSGVFRSCVSA